MKLYNIRLLPCPFCGSKQVSLNGEHGKIFVECDTCNAKGSPLKLAEFPNNSDEINAIKLWNARFGDKK
jgi:Lar family restriction alleviation protein